MLLAIWRGEGSFSLPFLLVPPARCTGIAPSPGAARPPGAVVRWATTEGAVLSPAAKAAPSAAAVRSECCPGSVTLTPEPLLRPVSGTPRTFLSTWPSSWPMISLLAEAPGPRKTWVPIVMAWAPIAAVARWATGLSWSRVAERSFW